MKNDFPLSQSININFTLIRFFKVVAAFAFICSVSSEYLHEGHNDIGYSFAKFSGPVSGPSHKVQVHDHRGDTFDFIAKPDYQFEYGVEDPKNQNSQYRKEHRVGDTVFGEYSLIDPLGKLRLVKYTADKEHGFRAEVYVDGKLLNDDTHALDQEAHSPSEAQESDNSEDDGHGDGEEQNDSEGDGKSESNEDYY